MKCSARPCATAARGTSVFIVSLILIVAGCATPARTPELIASPLQVPEQVSAQVSEQTWWQIDTDILIASLTATEDAEDYARGALADWRGRVSRRTEEAFIPWFTNYWTQQWLTIRLAWYKLDTAEEGMDSAVARLAAYLQAEHQDRVLKPAAGEIDLNVLREQASKLYVRSLDEQLREIGRRYGLPQNQVDRHLDSIAAIALERPPSANASLHQVLRAEPITSLGAYAALMARIRKDALDAEGGPLNGRISSMAKRSSEKLASTLAGSAGAGAAATVIGGMAGMAISLGAAGFGAFVHEQERPAMAAQLRQDLSTALDDVQRALFEDRAAGVMAGVHHMCGQIHRTLANAAADPIEVQSGPPGARAPDE